jgi:hypothetical protein
VGAGVFVTIAGERCLSLQRLTMLPFLEDAIIRRLLFAAAVIAILGA